ncbi:MAG: nucleoside deaminase [Ardenticatenaceae bacterium]
MSVNHHKFIRESFALAKRAVQKGNHPFGALLVKDEQILLSAENSVNSEQDHTRHAELNLVSRASQQLDPAILAKSVLYTSTEPCAMCCGAIYWAGISKVVYGCSAEALGKIAGDDFLIPCREILGKGAREIEVIGPVLEQEGLNIHQSFWI